MNLRLVRLKSAGSPGGFEYRGLDLEEVVEWFRKHSGAAGDVDEDVRLFLDGVIHGKEGEPEAEHLWVFSDYAMDREKERIDPTGWQLKNYKRNPVVLWSHLWWDPAIGTARQVHVQDAAAKGEKELVGRVKFDLAGSDGHARLIAEKVAAGVIRCGSVGFQPLKVEFADDSEDEKAKQDDTRIIHRKQELMEFSVCNIPMNPNSMVVADELNQRARGLRYSVSKGEVTYGPDGGIIVLPEYERAVRDAAAALSHIPAASREELAVPEAEKKVIPYADHGVADEDTAWDAAAEVKAATVEDLKIMCAWYDAEAPDVKASYKLPHHRQGDKKAVWNGVKAAMGALMGARGGVDIPDDDMKGCHAHLSKHYLKWGKEPPEMETAKPAATATLETRTDGALVAALEANTAALAEMAEAFRAVAAAALGWEKEAKPGSRTPSYIDGLFTDRRRQAPVKPPDTREGPRPDTRAAALDALVARR